MVERLGAQLRHEKLAARKARDALLNGQERADQRIRIAIVGRFAPRLDIAQLSYAYHAAEIGKVQV